ncbi:MAG: V-type ATP synthase subunit I [Candidatus Thorarchaeota archaeon]
MGLSMSPAKMVIAKIVTHKDFEREVLLSLEEFGLLEFIDIRQQTGVFEIPPSSGEEAALNLLDRLTHIASSLGLDVTRRIGQFVDVDDQTLDNTLKQANDVLKAIEAETLDISRDTAVAQLELQKQVNLRDVALSLEPLGLSLDLIGATDFTYTTAGVVPLENLSKLEWSIKEVTEGSYAMRSVAGGKSRSIVSLTVPVDLKPGVDRILSALGFEQFTLPEDSEGRPEAIIAEAEANIAKLEATLAQLEARRKLLAKEWGPRVLVAWELMEIERHRIEIKNYMFFTEQALKLWGYVPAKDAHRLEEILRRRIGTPLEITFEDPDFVEADSPTYLRNPSFMKPTEDVVGSYGIPSKHDLDPTKIMWLTFPLIFGLIFADVGQGFLILLIGIFAWRADKKGQDWGSTLGYVQKGAFGLITLGIFAMFGGFLFGSFFGAETVIEPIWPIFAHTLPNGEPNLFRATHMLKLSIEVGVLQMSMGILLNLYNSLKHRDYREATVALSYIWLYLGFVNLLFGVSSNSITNWFASSGYVNLWVPLLGIGYGSGNNGIYPTLPISPLIFSTLCFIIPFILLAVSSLKGGMDGFVEFLEYAIGMISHTVSYARIFALNAVHMILSGLFFQLLPPLVVIPMPHVVLFGFELIPEHIMEHGHLVQPYLPLLGAIVGTLVVGFLEGLAAFMHSLRLHFVEWFSKFYHAGGTLFQPYRITRLFTRPIHEVAAMPVVTTN